MPTQPLPTGRRLGFLFLGYLTAVVAVITLAPFRFGRPDEFHAAWVVLDGGWATDIVLNVVLFVPLGLLWHRSLGWTPVQAALLGLAAGLSIEIAQLFLAPRYSTASDVVANALGAGLGARLSQAVAERLQSRAMVSRLWLDQPLVGVVYLLLPLLWLDGLAAAGEPSRLWLLLPLAVAGALVVSAVGTTSGIAAMTGSGWHAVVAAAWFAIGMVPALRVSPSAAGRGLLAAVVATLLGSALWRVTLTRERRLEPQVVRALLPLLVLVAAGTALSAEALDGEGGEIARITILRLLEQLAVFTVLGYLVAESRGRRQEPLTRLVVPSVLVALGLVVLLAVSLTQWASIARPLACVVAAALGAVLYDAQRAHVLAILEVK